jgi:hypothetical protein
MIGFHILRLHVSQLLFCGGHEGPLVLIPVWQTLINLMVNKLYADMISSCWDRDVVNDAETELLKGIGELEGKSAFKGFDFKS